MYTINSMYNELAPLIPLYRQDNSWAINWFAPVNADNILEAFRLYKATYQNSLGLLLLGEEGMRKKQDLVINFGLTSAHGPEDAEAQFLNSLIPERQRLGGANAPKMIGPGSILSDRRWTPLLNDAWLLGGVHRQQDFHHVAEGVGSVAFDIVAERRAAFGAAAAQYNKTPIEKWRRWFLRNPQILYESWGPRVFTREALGLMTFGYRPVFSEHELGFRCANSQLAAGATFRAYFDALHALGFHQGVAAKQTVLTALSNYFFNDPNVLGQAKALP